MKILKILCLAALLGVSCTGNDDDSLTGTPGGGEVIPDGGLIFHASSHFLTANGQDAVIFTATKGGENVTDQVTIYNKDTKEEYTPRTFSTSVAGTYKFFATLGDEISEVVSISAVSGVPELPTDPNPDRYERFRRHVLITHFTSSACTYCPWATASLIEYFKANTSGDGIHAGVHVPIPSADKMTNESSLAIKNMIIVTSAPTLGFDLRKDLRFTMGASGLIQNIEANRKFIDNQINKRLALDASCGISAAVTASSTQIQANALVKVSVDGEYKIAAWLLEDGIKDTQINGTGITGYDFNTHNNVVRAISNVNYVPGDALGSSGSMKKGESARFMTTFNIKQAKVADLSKCKVLFIVSTNNASSPTVFYVTNLISCPVGGTAAFEYLK